MSSPRLTSIAAFLLAFGLQVALALFLLFGRGQDTHSSLGKESAFEFMMITGVVGLVIVAAVVIAVLAALAVMATTAAAFAYLVRCTLHDTHAASNRALLWFGASLLPPLVIGGSLAWRLWGKG